MARQKNPRRVILETLRDMARLTRYTVSAWNVASTVFAKGEDGQYRPVPRPADQYPEAQRAAWEDLAARALALESMAVGVRQFANEQMYRIDQGR
jgi:hypothetical protein